MRVVTLTSDIGNYSIPMIKTRGLFLKFNNRIKYVEICNEVSPYDIEMGAYLLNETFNSFPEGTIHIFSIDSSIDQRENMSEYSSYIIFQSRGHYFIGPNNGFCGLINNGLWDKSYIIESPKGETNLGVYTKMALQISSPTWNWQTLDQYMRDAELSLKRKEIRVLKNLMIFNIEYVDTFGNLITNLNVDDMEEQHKTRKFILKISREKIHSLDKTISATKPGEIFCYFNSSGKLKVGIKYGNASRLLGMNRNNSISILFID